MCMNNWDCACKLTVTVKVTHAVVNYVERLTMSQNFTEKEIETKKTETEIIQKTKFKKNQDKI